MKRLLAGIAVAGLAACGAPDTPVKNNSPVNVQVEDVQATNIPTRYVYSGNLEGIRRVNLSTKIMGPIVDMPVTEGSRVTAGQLLVRIKSDDISAKRAQIRANLIEAQAALTNVEVNYKRIKNLYDNRTATRKEMDDVEMAYRMAQARVQAVEEMEKEVTEIAAFGDLMSPINGYVTQKFLEPGDMASPGMPILTLEDLSRVRAAIQVPESEIGQFHKGRRVALRIDALPQSVLKGTVDEINAGANPISRQFDVKVLVDAETQHLRSGLFVQVILEDNATSGVMIRQSSIHRRGQLDGVFILTPANEALLRWIKTGQHVNGQVEVLAGLVAGEKLIVQSDGRLLDGLKVQVAK